MHAWAALRQSHKQEETLDIVETKRKYTVIAIHACMHGL